MTEPSTQAPPWRPTWALRRTVFILVLLTGAALIFGQGILALLALPIAIGSALAWADRPTATTIGLTVDAPRLGDQLRPAEVSIDLSGDPSLQIATVQAPHSVAHAPGRLVAVAPRDGRKVLTFPIDTSRWGTVDFGATAVIAAGPDGLVVTEPVTRTMGTCRLLPAVRDVSAAELPTRAAGQVGAHRTRRPGDGSELLDIREFRTGDRLRRIDWRVSARRGEMYVRHTAIDADAELVLCIDPRFDVGPVVAEWSTRAGANGPHGSPAGSLDTTVRISAALAATYLQLGDRVGLVNLAVPEWGVPLGSGHHQLARIRWQLAGLAAAPEVRDLNFRAGAVPPGAVAVVLSPLLDEIATSTVATLARSHRDVLVLDVTPPALELPSERSLRAAARLVLAEREHRIAMLRQHGVIVTTWQPERVRQLIQRKQRARRAS
jgi:uncharacterized protein (DUF58 family)